MALKIVAISDTHNAHNKLVIPECDILIHAGDESMQGSPPEIMNFAEWLNKQPAKHLVWVPGNHSVGFEKWYPSSEVWIKNYCPRVNVLVNQDVTLEGVKIWGSPVTPWFHDWAWNVNRGPAIKQVWDKIPLDTSIVVTHGPPYGILDVADKGKWREMKVGCQDLMDAMLRIKPKYHIFGHIHECHGTEFFMDTMYVNASIMDEHYDPVNQPIVLEL